MILARDGRPVAKVHAIDPDQAWFWTPGWQAKEREVDEERAAGPAVAARLVLLGVGIGLVMQPLVTLGQTIAADRVIGAASSAILTARGFGGALSVAAFGALLGQRLTDLTGTTQSLATAINQVFTLGIPVAALLLLAVAAATRPTDR